MVHHMALNNTSSIAQPTQHTSPSQTNGTDDDGLPSSLDSIVNGTQEALKPAEAATGETIIYGTVINQKTELDSTHHSYKCLKLTSTTTFLNSPFIIHRQKTSFTYITIGALQAVIERYCGERCENPALFKRLDVSMSFGKTSCRRYQGSLLSLRANYSMKLLTDVFKVLSLKFV